MLLWEDKKWGYWRITEKAEYGDFLFPTPGHTDAKLIVCDVTIGLISFPLFSRNVARLLTLSPFHCVNSFTNVKYREHPKNELRGSVFGQVW